MMLLQLLLNQPQAIAQIVSRTPVWVWGLLGGLVALGLSQTRAREVGIARILITPLAMTAFSVWGMVGSFGHSPLAGGVALAWLAAAAGVFALIVRGTPAGRFDATSATFALPGSYTPLALIVAVFLAKYVVQVELALQPAHSAEAAFAYPVAVLFGALTGSFLGRAARLLKLALPGRLAIAA